MMTPFSIALDGPSGAGKSTIAKALATELGAVYLDTGAMYRAIGLYMKRLGICEAAAAVSARVTEAPLSVRHIGDTQHVFLNDEDVSELIRQPEVSMLASAMGAIPAVRSHLVDLQREIGTRTSIVMDGRDIGTVVLKDSPCKIFLTAASEERARRRYVQQLAKGDNTPYEQVLRELIARDEQDMNRKTDPLRQAEDAVLVDSTEMTEAETVEAIVKIVEEVYGKQ